MSSWFEVTPESSQMLSEERLILACTELVYQAMDEAGVETKQELANLLGVSKNEVGQRLSGRRNLTVKTLAAMLHVLGKEADVTLRPIRKYEQESDEEAGMLHVHAHTTQRKAANRSYSTARVTIAKNVVRSESADCLV